MGCYVHIRYQSILPLAKNGGGDLQGHLGLRGQVNHRTHIPREVWRSLGPKALPMERSLKHSPRAWQTDEEIDRVNARLRHFRGVAAGVMYDAQELLRDIWDSCQDPRSWQDIVDGVPEPVARTPAGGWAEFHEKLHLLGTYLEYAKRLCEGSLEK
jgi:hypothetical protein